MEINLLSGALGAEVTGIDLKDSSIENWNKINSTSNNKLAFGIKISKEKKWKGADCINKKNISIPNVIRMNPSNY